jgi:hypothetical protein
VCFKASDFITLLVAGKTCPLSGKQLERQHFVGYEMRISAAGCLRVVQSANGNHSEGKSKRQKAKGKNGRDKTVTCRAPLTFYFCLFPSFNERSP